MHFHSSVPNKTLLIKTILVSCKWCEHHTPRSGESEDKHAPDLPPEQSTNITQKHDISRAAGQTAARR